MTFNNFKKRFYIWSNFWELLSGPYRDVQISKEGDWQKLSLFRIQNFEFLQIS